MKHRFGRIVWALALVVSSACQSVLGDFTVTEAPPDAPPITLGTACEPGEYRCTNEVLETCSDDRSQFVAVETCASANECNLNTRSCRPCTFGETMCRGSDLEQCDATGAWTLKETCAAAALCDIAPDHMSGMCAMPIVRCSMPGEHHCDDATLVRCSEGRDAVERVALCENPELCDAAYANELSLTGTRGACKPPACAPDAWSCEGATLRHCAIDRTEWEEVTACESPDLCSAANAACGPCEPEQIECNAAELRRCRASGGWETLEICKAAALCDADAGRCQPTECAMPGLLRCINNDGVPSLERCSEEFAWEVAEVCVTLQLCSVSEGGRCLAPACGTGAVRCNGNRHETCSADRTRWETDSTCAAGQLCHPELGCIAGPCTDGAVRCNGSSLERCASARFEESMRCETPELCDETNARCDPAMCPPPPSFNCASSSIIEVCPPGREGFVEYRTCTTGTCDATPAIGTGKPECDVCMANVYECDEAQDLVRCSSDGQARVKVRTCATCDASVSPPICN